MTQTTHETRWKRHSGYEGGAHYSTFSLSGHQAMAALRELFPEGKADELNFCLFSTSGVHGSYTTIEQVEESFRKYGLDPDFVDDADDRAIPNDY